MPFVDSTHRMFPDPTIPGDRCFMIYKRLIEIWEKEPRWTTADRLYGQIMAGDGWGALYQEHAERVPDQNDWKKAAQLAWQVFFIKKVMPYENDKCRLNGDI